MNATTQMLCLAMLISGSALAEERSLDGRTYAIKFKEKGGMISSKDNLQFRAGRFRSSACDPYGFGDANYTAQDPVSFTADTQSQKEGHIQWQGTLRGDQIEGTFVWTKPGKAPIAYTFQGSAVAATPPKGFDQKTAREHLLKHQSYPATKAQLVASCNNLMDFSPDDKKWFSEALPEGTYQSAADVMKVVAVK